MCGILWVAQWPRFCLCLDKSIKRPCFVSLNHGLIKTEFGICETASHQRRAWSNCESQTIFWMSGASSLAVVASITSLPSSSAASFLPHPNPFPYSILWKEVTKCRGGSYAPPPWEEDVLELWNPFHLSWFESAFENPGQFWWVFSGLRVLVIRPVVLTSGPLLYETLQWSHPGDFFANRLRKTICLGWWIGF